MLSLSLKDNGVELSLWIFGKILYNFGLCDPKEFFHYRIYVVSYSLYNFTIYPLMRSEEKRGKALRDYDLVYTKSFASSAICLIWILTVAIYFHKSICL